MKLAIIYEQQNLVIGRDQDNQLYVGGVFEDGTRQFTKIQSYSLKFNGTKELDSYTLEDGSRVSILDESVTDGS